MNWLSEIDDSEQQSINEMNAGGLGKAPKQPKKEVGLFDGAATAIPRGVAAGAIKAYDTAKKPFERVADHLQYSIDDVQNGGLDGALDVREKSFSDVHEEKNKDRRDALVMQVEELQDTPNSGLVGNILFGVSDYATRALIGAPLGPAGAALTTGLSETNYSREDLIHKGVDEDTATTTALIDGGVAAASTVLPLSYGFKGTGGVVKDAALSVGGATALSTAGQYASGQVLESEGYDKQAKKYEITGESVGTDLALNALMFGAARGASRYLNKTPEQVEAEIDQERAALVLNELEFEKTLTPVKATDPVQQNNHLKNLDASVEAIRMGRPVNVVHPVKGEEKQRPVTISPSEYKNIRYDDPRLDALLGNKAKSMDMEWAVPLLTAVRRAGEKSHNNQVSPKGAQSIMQIMPETKAGLERTYKKKWDINNPEHATEMALYLVREMSEQYKTKDPFVLAAHYNGGFVNGKAMQKNGKPKATETINYVNRVKDFINTGKYKNYTGNNVSTSMGMDGSSYDFAYEVKSLGDLIASNDTAYGVNPLYPADLQPRDRTREASRQQIENMADDLKPEWLGESAKLSDGAPIIGVDNVVESGNGRTLAINRAYETGKADNYRAYIEKYAAEKGWDISGIDRPVLVRTRLTDTDRVQFTQLANQTDVAQFSATERAKTDADRLPDTSLIKLNADGNINLEQSMDFVRSFVSQLPKSEQASVITGDGRLSQDGKRRIESAIAQRAYNDSGLIARLSENLDDDSKSVLNALLRVAPQVAQLNDLVKQGGRHSNTLADDLAQAAQKLSDLKANGMRVDDYLNQGQLIEDGLSDGAKAFLNVFDSNKRSAKAISDNIQSEIDRIEGMGDPRQGGLFGEELTQVKSVQDQIIEMLSNSSKYSADYINDAAKIVASIYHSTAKQMGITADELFARFPMRITDASSVESGTTFGQSNLSNQITTKSFKNWFGDWENDAANASKVVDDNGEPLVVYHGTDAEFDTFDYSFFGKTDEGFAGKGFYFTNYGDLTSEYGSRQIKVYLSAKNPFITEDYNALFRKYGLETNRDLTGETSKLLQDNLKKDGYDGVFVMDYENNAHEYIVFSPNQIKSADGNDGAFNPDNPNMYKQANGGTRGSITFNVGQDGSIITLNKDADFSTFVHELGHHFLEMHMQLKEQGALPENLSKDMDVVMDWAGLNGVKFKDLTPEQSLNLHEKFAETFEQYLSSGKAPTPELKDVFNRFKSWMIQAYKTLQSLIKQTPRAELSQDIVDVMDSMLGAEKVRVASLFDDVIEGDAVANIIMQNPDQQISVSRIRPDGEMEEITMTLRERLDELEAEVKQAEQDTLATQTAISCALQFGE